MRFDSDGSLLWGNHRPDLFPFHQYRGGPDFAPGDYSTGNESL
jgi:hypothetical protein